MGRCYSKCHGLRWRVNRWVFRPRQNLGSESVVLSAPGSLFHSLGASRANSLGRVDRCPGVFSEGSVSILCQLIWVHQRGCKVQSGFESMEVTYLLWLWRLASVFFILCQWSQWRERRQQSWDTPIPQQLYKFCVWGEQTDHQLFVLGSSYVSKCPGARHWTPNCSWWACWCLVWFPLPSVGWCVGLVCVWMNGCVNGWMWNTFSAL